MLRGGIFFFSYLFMLCYYFVCGMCGAFGALFSICNKYYSYVCETVAVCRPNDPRSLARCINNTLSVHPQMAFVENAVFLFLQCRILRH